jgi:hypothetical protein
MTLHEAIRAHILDQTAITTMGLAKIFPTMLQQVSTSDYPFAVVRRISGAGDVSHSGTQGLNRVRISITWYDNNVARAERGIALIRSTFAGFSGELGGSGGVRCSFGGFSGPRSIYDEITRSNGQQLDILGLVDEDTIS